MIPASFTAQGADAACILIIEKATKRRNQSAPKTLTPREHAQCQALRELIKCYQQQRNPSTETMQSAKAAAATVAIQL